MNEELLHLQRVIAAESEAAGFGTLMGNASNVIVSYLQKVRHFMADLVTPIPTAALTFSQDTGLNKMLGKTNYISLGTLDIYVPQGMHVPFMELMDALEVGQQVVDNLMDGVLDPSITYFSKLLGSPETMSAASRLSEEASIKLQEKGIAAARAATGKCFTTNGNTTRRPYGDVFKRNQDWLTVNTKLDELIQRMAKVPPGLVAKRVDDLVEVMDRLCLRMKQSPDVYAANGITGAALAKVANNLGQVVEFYAAHYFMIQMVASTMADNIKRLKEILERG